MQPVQGGVPPVAGRTPIACINCASAKTGCDKRVPCSRCAEKNLPCEARFARRTAKAANRQASSSSLSTVSTIQHTQIDTNSPEGVIRKNSINDGGNFSQGNSIDSQPQRSPQKKQEYLPSGIQGVTDVFVPSPDGSGHAMDTFMCLNDEFLTEEVNYQDLMIWNQYPSELEMYPNSGPELHHPLEIPAFMELAEASSSLETTANGSMDTAQSMSHTRTTSETSQAEYERPLNQIEVEVSNTREAIVIAAEAAWPLARCNIAMPSGSCPRTAIIHLENLEQHSRHENTWRLLDSNISPAEVDNKNEVSVVPLNPRTRDRILAITQSFLHTALETHRGGLKDSKSGSPDSVFNYLVLPPSNVLEYFLRSYVRSLAPYYTLINGSILDPNELMLNNQASTLLLLLMIAQGATALPSAEARCLAAGLTETCRISLFHVIEKDVELSADPIILRSALLFTIIGAWSGDAWHMNIAMGQRGMYLSMLKHAGMLEPCPQLIVSSNDASSRELQWRAWQQRESRSRLVIYSLYGVWASVHDLRPHTEWLCCAVHLALQNQ
jgi:Fungal Zn(2)-Cys(6) binuclear cluster domain